jgi:hypothetical protein
MTITEEAIEALSRAVEPSCWAVMDDALRKHIEKYKGRHVGWPKDQFKYKEGLAKARATMSVLASLGYVVVPIGTLGTYAAPKEKKQQ